MTGSYAKKPSMPAPSASSYRPQAPAWSVRPVQRSANISIPELPPSSEILFRAGWAFVWSLDPLSFPPVEILTRAVKAVCPSDDHASAGVYEYELLLHLEICADEE